ncbi:MAG: hypothetical protein J6L84_03285 [Clostridiales bacterium]|nr:hypothetical protein [Clostridiales bacterium]
MENITLGQIAAAAAFLVALGISFKKLKEWTIDAIKAAVKEELGQLSSEIKELQNELRKEDKEKTKNFLVARLNEIENGETWSEIERQRFYEQYDHYTNDLNGNTYIKKAVEAHEKEGKIWR